ncbi:MAG: glycosyltransferase [Candidatus Thermoplasmatota archaeon]|nr:glycosyltransferase [Candidatus Thermoplasmatota archaeon]
MNIAMVTDTWLPTKDGVVNSIIQFRKSLEKLGHQVYVFAPGKENKVSKKDDNVFFFKSKKFRPYPDYRMAIYPTGRTQELLLEKNIDVIHNHGMGFMAVRAMVASKFLELPCVFNFHTWVTDALHYSPVHLSDNLLERLAWIYLRYLLRRSDTVIAPSEKTLNDLKGKCSNMHNSTVVAPPIDRSRYNKDVDGSSIRKKWDLEDETMLLHVGRIAREKNLELIIDALPYIKKERPDVRLFVVGDGPAKSYYESLAAEKGLNDIITFTGFVPEKELPNYYGAADAFLIASTFETLGLVMLEALATGTPVIGLDHGVIPNIINQGNNGLLFQEDPKDCAEKTLKVLRSEKEINNNFIKDTPLDNLECGKKLEEVYESAIQIKKERIS